MLKNINGFRLNRNGKPITTEVGEVRHKDFRGAMYKEEGTYYFYVREQNGKFVYKP